MEIVIRFVVVGWIGMLLPRSNSFLINFVYALFKRRKVELERLLLLQNRNGRRFWKFVNTKVNLN